MSQRYNDYMQCGAPTISDAATGRLRVSQSHDAIEHEADALAARALSGKAPQTPMAKQVSFRHTGTSSLGSSGRALDADTRSFFEPRFGADFSTVRVHADDAAHAKAMRMEARAYTYGRDIVFARGEYSPSTIRGRELLGHELAHVMQQDTHSATAGVIARQPADDPPWLQDGDGALYYLTRAAAQKRLEALENKGEWQELRVVFFKRELNTYNSFPRYP